MKLPLSTMKTPVAVYRVFALAATRRELRKAALGLALSAVRFFFVPQFDNAITAKRKVVNVDHPLDLTIPFEPRLVGKYLEFFQMWLGALKRLHQTFGESCVPDLAEYVRGIDELYRDAGRVYCTVHSTTKRPAENPSLHFAVIHALDPHLNCVPSLHVTVVLSGWMYAVKTATRHGNTDDPETAEWLGYVYGEAIQIVETILFMKQHSINCVAASLFYLNQKFPDFFTDTKCRTVISDLFTYEGKDLPRKEEIRSYIAELYGIMTAKAEKTDKRPWFGPLVEFLDTYEVHAV